VFHTVKFRTECPGYTGGMEASYEAPFG
jgi:hypothetical protein